MTFLFDNVQKKLLRQNFLRTVPEITANQEIKTETRTWQVIAVTTSGPVKIKRNLEYI